MTVKRYKHLLNTRIPITKWLPLYTLPTLFQDLLAGITVGMTEIPQGIAYAIVAGLPPEYGLYSGLIDGFIYAIFGGCKDLNIGPTSILSLMLQPHVASMGPDASTLMTFISGIIIFCLGVMHLGFVIQFFSYPIIAGFICGGSFQIASSQLKSLFGIPGKNGNFLESWTSVFENFSQVRKWDTVLGVTSIVALVALKEIRVFGSLHHRPDWSPRRNFLGKLIFLLSLARNALIVIIGTLISYYLYDQKPFKITGKVSGGFPPFKPPPFSTNFTGTESTFSDMVQGYGVSFIFIPLLSILEAVSIAKAFSKGRKLDATQEMLALGLCNTFGSFFGSMPVTGSFTRSAVNNASGVRTPLAGIFTSLLLLVAIAFLTPTFYYVPKATLASVIIAAMFYLFDFGAFSLLWKTKKLDLVPFLTTFLCSLFLGVDYGILIGASINLLFVLYASARPKFTITKEKIPNDGSDIYVITPRDTLFFPAAEFLRDTVLECEGDQVTVIINGKYIRNMDITVAKSISVLAHELNLRKSKVMFVNFKESVMKICLGVDKKLENYFFSEEYYNSVIKDTSHELDSSKL
ncbi:sodium-independent sulfate anion transporter-like isoform X2 [Tribolium madens]|uniref:sodium-independent sulfate anion transporter-like isoform X2 n=1 Tax=Tribolium madens TaxID=41895 RepID=UPI001CF71D81|nr:sodium-independent sulfate anion transporter-like isoform X2 [Tribolium madens]